VEDLYHTKPQLSGNYHVIPGSTVLDEGLRPPVQQYNNQGLINYNYYINDINNYISNINPNEVKNILI
jgi:hypothetical protein